MLAINGPDLSGEDRHVLRAFTDQLAVALHSHELQAEAATAETLIRANELRTALLRAVSHDLRTPLASIKASASTLLADDLHLPPDATRSLLTTIDEEADRLNTLIGNLLDMSRLQSGTFESIQRDVGLDEIVAQALANLGERFPPSGQRGPREPAAHPHRRRLAGAGGRQRHRQRRHVLTARRARPRPGLRHR